MKNLRLKRWVKVSLIIMVLVCFLVLMGIQYNKAVEDCVNAGHNQTYCENGLR